MSQTTAEAPETTEAGNVFEQGQATTAPDYNAMGVAELRDLVAATHQVPKNQAEKLSKEECVTALTADADAAQAVLKTARRRLAGSKGGAARAKKMAGGAASSKKAGTKNAPAAATSAPSQSLASQIGDVLVAHKATAAQIDEAISLLTLAKRLAK